MDSNTNNNQTDITLADLSPAEKEQIKLAREKADLEAKEKALEKELKREKAIKSKKEEIQKEIAEQIKTKAATEKFLAELVAIDPNFVLDTHKWDKTFEAWDYEYFPDPEHEGKFKHERVVYHSENAPMEQYKIKHKISGDTIEVKEHFTGSYGRTNQGFKMFFAYGTNRPYINAKKIANIVQEKIDKKNREIKFANDKATAKDLAEIELKAKYPEATLEHGTRHTRYYGVVEAWVAKFKNGISVKYRYELRGGKLELTFDEVEGINNNNIDKVINALKGI